MIKGQASLVVIFFILGMGVLTAANYLSITGKAVVDTFGEDVHTLNTVLGLAKEYSRTSLRYSLYQACYDTLGSGKELPTVASFTGMLNESIRKSMKLYTKDGYTFQADYHVKLPEYTVSLKDAAVDRVFLSADGDKLSISKEYLSQRFGTRRVSIMMDSSIDDAVPTDCWKVYQDAAAEFESVNHTLWEELNRVMAGWPEGEISGTGISASTHEGICDGVFRQSTMMTMAEAEANITGELERANLGSAAPLPPEVDINWTFVKSDPNPDGSVNASCTFMVEANASAEIRKEGTVPHPVFDGKELKMSALSARFRVKTSLTGKDVNPAKPDMTAPSFLSGPGIKNLGQESVEITFKADEPVKATVSYWAGTGQAKTAEWIADYRDDHTIPLGGLSPSTSYQFNVTITDQSGNSAESGNIGFKTL